MEGEPMLQVGYVDGCFDLMHSGHFNAILQAKKMSHKLVVGIHSNEEIEKNKGPPVMSESERYEMLTHVKWIDEIAYDVPYSPSIEILDKYNCDKAFHGDDMPVNSDGVGAYDVLRNAGRLQVFPRTEGLSTTDFIGRLMSLTRSSSNEDEAAATSTLSAQGIHMLQSTSRIVEFSQPYKSVKDSDRVVYIDGTFDIFNIAHATTLQKAKELGTYLIVGLYSDQVVRQLKGTPPVSSLFERMLCVLSCKHVDSIVMDVPVTITADMLSSLRISVVVCGSHTRTNYSTFRNGAFVTAQDGEQNIFTDPEGAYKVPRERGIFVEVASEHPTLCVETFIHRVAANRAAYVQRNSERVDKEKKYYKEKNESTTIFQTMPLS